PTWWRGARGQPPAARPPLPPSHRARVPVPLSLAAALDRLLGQPGGAALRGVRLLAAAPRHGTRDDRGRHSGVAGSLTARRTARPLPPPPAAARHSPGAAPPRAGRAGQ